jgi:transporter family-2 protein
MKIKKMDKFFWIFMVFLAGALLPVQAGLNARIGKEIQSPVWAALISFVVGTMLLLLYIFFTAQKMHTPGLNSIPLQNWVAGGLGAFYITVSILAFPRLGAALTFALVVTAQVVISMLMDHFQILVSQQQSISWQRVVGLLMVIGGVVLIRKF